GTCKKPRCAGARSEPEGCRRRRSRLSVSAESRVFRYLVSGKVQGVYYRGSTVVEAKRLGIAGWARNLPDGRVEVVARGNPESLAALADWLWKGPPQAAVEGVRAELWTGEDVDIGSDFVVR